MLISLSFSVAIYQISSSEIGQGLGKQARTLQNRSRNDIFPNIMQDMEKIRLEQIEESSNNLQRNLFYYNLLILLLSSIASYFFAKKTLEPIEKSYQNQNRFTADASHELRTPLTAMRSEIEVNLRDKNLSILEAKQLLKSNLEEVNKLERLSSALLKLSKSDQDQDIDFKKLSSRQIILKTQKDLFKHAAQKNIRFLNKIENAPIFGDEHSLIELFTILFDNAIKYSPNNSIISTFGEKTDKKTIIKIVDQGVGIKESDIPYIFDRFFRADQSRNKSKINGYGLGLSIAKAIVLMHHGEILVKSKLNVGSQFIVKFPFLKQL